MNLRELARRQLHDYDRHQPGMAFADPGFQLTIEQAYDLQFHVAELRQARGERLAGYKIGCISRTMQQQLGLDRPVFGHVWETELHSSGTVFRTSDFDRLAIEGEYAVRLAADVPSVEWFRTHPDIFAAGFVVIELHNYVFRGSSDNRAAELIANNAIHAGVVLPVVETSLHRAESLLAAVLTVTRGGQVLGEAAGCQLEGGPVAGIPQLIEHLQRRGRRLCRGEIVLTGSPLPLWPVSGGDHIDVRTQDFGWVNCRIESDAEPSR